MVLKYGCFAKIKIIDRRGHGDRDFLFTPQVFISNHQSLLDIPLTLLKFQVPPIMKKQVLYIPVIGIMGWAAGSVIVDRTSRGSRKQVLLKCKKRLMEEKFTLHYYPEGTRNRESDRPKEFEKIKTPLIRLAFQSQVPVNPVSLCGTQKINRKGGLFYPGQKIGMLLSEPIDPKNFSDEEAFAKACWNQVQTGYDELKNIIS
jgi:1-acyl-sn-glycerol-3-phosphate acyltransferase